MMEKFMGCLNLLKMETQFIRVSLSSNDNELERLEQVVILLIKNGAVLLISCNCVGLR